MDFIESTLIIAGKGKDEGFLHDLVRGQNYPGRIEISGYIDNNHKDEFISRSYMVILPSRAEGQGIVILEAAACGKPVIVSDIPELKYAVDAGFGLSFKTGDAEDLAEKIKYLIQNESLRKEMGARAREYAKDFTWDKIAETFDNYITSIASQNSSGR
jgi:glycosyltransferase involved in cell wall biosynthesis